MVGSKAPVENASNSSIHENTKEVNSIYKKDEVVTQEVAENSVAQQYARSSNISIADILEKNQAKSASVLDRPICRRMHFFC